MTRIYPRGYIMLQIPPGGISCFKTSNTPRGYIRFGYPGGYPCQPSALTGAPPPRHKVPAHGSGKFFRGQPEARPSPRLTSVRSEPHPHPDLELFPTPRTFPVCPVTGGLLAHGTGKPFFSAGWKLFPASPPSGPGRRNRQDPGAAAPGSCSLISDWARRRAGRRRSAPSRTPVPPGSPPG